MDNKKELTSADVRVMNASKADWILGDNLYATKTNDAEYRVRRAGSQETAVITWSQDTGRMLIDGEDIELDERCWGLADELEGIHDDKEHFSQGYGEDCMEATNKDPE